MKNLFLADMDGLSVEDVKKHIVSEYQADTEDLDKFEILIAYESVGSWGCDSSSFFLLRETSSGRLFENHGSHCSCYGFEDQWGPTETSIEYLTSEKFYVSMGGYDADDAKNRQSIKDFMTVLAGDNRNNYDNLFA